MKHDNEWLNRLYQNGSYENLNCEPFYLVDSVQDACKDYHEHMNRWRPITEAPESGQWAVFSCIGKSTVTHEVQLVDNDLLEDIDTHGRSYRDWLWMSIVLPESDL